MSKNDVFTSLYLDMMRSAAMREESLYPDSSLYGSDEQYFLDNGYVRLSIGRVTGKTSAAAAFVKSTSDSIIVALNNSMKDYIIRNHALNRSLVITLAEFLKSIDTGERPKGVSPNVRNIIFDESGKLFDDMMVDKKFDKIKSVYPKLRMVYSLGTYRCFG